MHLISGTPKRAVFVRPSLGIGGAERWAVDAALALQANGWDVEIAVNQFDPDRTFSEARDGRVKVTALGGRPAWCAGGRLRAMSALLGQWVLLRRLRRSRPGPGPDLFICDLVPHAAGWIRRWFPESAVMIYCHHPDVLTVKPRGLYGLYRAAIARQEVRGMGAAHRVLANSRFTADAIALAFPELDRSRLAVVYPGSNGPNVAERGSVSSPERKRVCLTVARLDPSKNLELAVAAFTALKSKLSAAEFARWRWVIAGGYDRRLPEARELVGRLRAQASASGIGQQVELRFDPSAEALESLWSEAFALVHPAKAEHFGIVLIEAMARGLPVLAVDHGGPREIVQEGATGALRPPETQAFAEVLAKWIEAPEAAAALGRAGQARAESQFSMSRFAADFTEQAELACAAAGSGSL